MFRLTVKVLGNSLILSGLAFQVPEAVCSPLHYEAQDILYTLPNALLIRRIFNQASELGTVPSPMWAAGTVAIALLGGSFPSSGTLLT